MAYFILFYKTSEHYLEDRKPFRAQHLALAKAAQESGILLLAGALETPSDEAMLIFKAEQISEVENFAKTDPYVIHKVVKNWVISPWNVAMGTLIEP